MREFKGKVVVITGAASGIGRSVAEILHAKGAVVAALDINPEVTEFNEVKGILGIECDLTSESSIKESVDSVIRNFGGLDILVSKPVGHQLPEASMVRCVQIEHAWIIKDRNRCTACCEFHHPGEGFARAKIAANFIPTHKVGDFFVARNRPSGIQVGTYDGGFSTQRFKVGVWVIDIIYGIAGGIEQLIQQTT